MGNTIYKHAKNVISESKIRLLLLFTVTLTMFQVAVGQSWTVEGSAQFTNEAQYVATDIHPTTGEIYVAYVDETDNEHLKVKMFDGTNWVDVGATISQAGNVLFPSIRIHPLTGEPWVAYRSDYTSSSRVLMVKRFDGTSWVTEGSNIASTFFSFKSIPTQKIILRFSPSGDAYVAYSSPTSATSSNNFAVVVTNSSGSWATATSGQSHTPFGMDYPTYRTIYDAVSFGTSSNPKVQLTRKVYNADNDSWSTPTNIGSDFPNSNYEGLGVIPESTIAALHNFNSNTDIDIRTWSGALAEPANSTLTQGRSIQFLTNPVDGLRYLLYVKTTGDVVITTFDGSSWTEVGGLNANVGSTTVSSNALMAKLNIRESDGRVYVTYQDGTSLTTKYLDVTPAPTKFYVDLDATGNNDGTSWANAFTNIQDALDAAEASIVADTIWVKGGTYNPTEASGSDARSAALRVRGNGLKIFGGFAGTETTLAQRNPGANETIISGDLNGDDDPSDLTFFSNLRDDNVYNLVYLRGNDVEINGFTLTGGQANISGSADRTDRGAAIYMEGDVSKFTLKHSRVAYNISRVNGAVALGYSTGGTKEVLIENCIFDHNISRYGSAVSVITSVTSTTVNAEIYNSLFHHNEAKDLNFQDGFSGTVGMLTNNGAVNLTAVNNTFAYNVHAGSASANDKGSIILRRNQTAGNGQITAAIHNNIFFENYSDENGTILTQQIGTMNVSNKIESLAFTHNNATQTNFGTKSLSVTVNNNLNADPLFTDGSNGDFTLQSSSTMIDAGDSTKVPSTITTDLSGVSRAINSTVDIGAYEYFLDNTPPTVSTKNITVSLDENGEVVVAASTVDDGSSDDIVPASSLNFSLDNDTFGCSDIGVNTVTLTVTDLSGNAATGTAEITVVDDLAPTAIAQDVTVELDSFGIATLTAVEVNNGSSDNCAISSIRLLNDSTYDCADRGKTLTNVLRVEDNHGNVDSVTFNVTVEDNIAPVLLAKDVTVGLDSSGTATVYFDQLHDGLSDNCAVQSRNLDSVSYDCSNLGENELIIFAYDSSINITRDTIIITVVDTIAPVVETQDISVELDDNGNATITAAQIDNGTADNCGGVTLSLDITAFTLADEGANMVTLTATDASGNTATGTATVTVIGNQSPVIIDSLVQFSIDEDAAATTMISDLTTRFEDPEGDTITYMVMSSDSSLTAELVNGVEVVITPAANFFGEVTVTTTATDANGGSTSMETVVTINPVNDAPVIENPLNSLSLNEDQGQVTVNLENIFSDVENDPLSYSFTNNNAALEVELDSANAQLVIDLIPDANGNGVLEVSASDGDGSVSNAIQVEVLPVNDQPVITGSDVNLDEDFSGPVTSSLSVEQPANESDQQLSVTVAPDPTTITWADISFDSQALTFTVNPVPNAFGSQVFTVIVDDGQQANNQDTTSVTILVNPVNDAPAFSLSDSTLSLKQDFTQMETISLTDLSPENETEGIAYTLTPSSVSFVDISINSETGEIAVGSVAGETGSQVFTITAEDELGATYSFSDLEITVTPNRAPEVIGTVETQTLDEDFGSATVVSDLSTVFEDPDGDEMSFSVASDNADITVSLDNQAVTVSAADNYFGTANITVEASDGELSERITFAVEIRSVNDAPEVANSLSDLSFEAGFGSEEIDLSGIFSDADEDQLTLTVSSDDETVVTAAISSSTLTITEIGSGSSNITVTAEDGQGGSVSTTFEVAVEAVTSVDRSFNVVVYPNPVEDVLKVETSQQILSISVTDLQGRELISLKGETPQVNVGALPAGQFMVFIQTDSGFKRIKIVKQ